MAGRDWQRPTYQGADVLELETLAASPDHPDEVVRQWSEHVLMLTFQRTPRGIEYWGTAWLARNEGEPWHQVLRTDGGSPDNGDNERRLIRECRERITRRMS